MSKKTHKITSYLVTTDPEEYKPVPGGPNSVMFNLFTEEEFDELVEHVISCYDPKCVFKVSRKDREYNPSAVFIPRKKGENLNWFETGSGVVYMIPTNFRKLYRISPSEFLRNIRYWASKLCWRYEDLRRELGDEKFKEYLEWKFEISDVIKSYECFFEDFKKDGSLESFISNNYGKID